MISIKHRFNAEQSCFGNKFRNNKEKHCILKLVNYRTLVQPKDSSATNIHKTFESKILSLPDQILN